MQALGSKWPVSLIDTEGDYASAENIRALEQASAVVVSVGYDRATEKENSDRTFRLPEGQDELIEFALKHNENVIVVVYAGGSVDMSRWKDKAAAILMGWYPGQEGGLAIARILSGEISPSGRLPMTFENRLEDNPSSANYFAGPALTKRGLTNRYVTYEEGVFVGYRGYERNGVKPSYPFGHGLTYSSFKYSGLSVIPAGDGFDVSFTLTNTGQRTAAEVAQIYVGEQNPTVLRPLKELKGYAKVLLKKGESERVTLHLDNDAFAFYDVNCHDWRVNPGKFNIYVGASVEDIKLETQVTVGSAGNELKVLSYNIRVISAKDGDNQWKHRAAASPAMIRDCAPDVFGLQEALPEQVKYMSESLKEYSCIGVGRDDGVSKGEHMSIFYNNATVELNDWGTYWLSETPDVPSKGWDAAYKRTATWALMTMKDSGRKFFYVNTHLDHSGREAQRKGLDLIVRKIAEMNKEGLPMVLTGDFNVEPDNPVLDELDERMSSARASAGKTDNIGTYNGWGTRALVIDYIYHSGFSLCREYRTIVKQYEGVPYVSDHYPIMSHLVF
jgi:endonuclease/exonuclease/phosphatase family metal-dependent hydrolase